MTRPAAFAQPSLLLVALLLAGCSDYGFTPDSKGAGVDDTGPTGGDTGPFGACPPPAMGVDSISVDESCEAPPEIGTFTPVIEWTQRSVGDVYASPVVGQLTDDDGDGDVDTDDMPDIVVAGYSGTGAAMSGDGGTVHWTFSGLGSEPSTPAIGDVDGDGRPDVVFAASTGIFAVRGDGTRIWTYSPGSFSLGVCGGVSIYDLDGDGQAEVVHGNLILNGRDGSLRGTGRQGAGTGYSSGTYAAFGVAADMDLDGDLEVVVGNAVYDDRGGTVWSNGASDGFVAVANFDEDDYPEIVSASYASGLQLHDNDGTTLWTMRYTGSTIGPPTVADFDGDGLPEIGVAGQGRYVVVEHDGRLKWSKETNDYSSGFTGSAVFDFEGDGKAEVVYADENDVWVFDGSTGAVKMRESAHSSATCSESPVIADVDNDGQAEIVYASGAFSGSETGVTVIGDRDDSWQPAAGHWNQHAYSITNVSDGGLIPADPEPNWLTYNNFRSGDLSAATGGALTDAVPLEVDVCTDECDAGHLYVSLQVGNQGLGEIPAGMPITLYTKGADGWVKMDDWTTTDSLPSGTTNAGLTLDLDPADYPEAVKIVVDDAGRGLGIVSECNEGNNELVITDVCP